MSNKVLEDLRSAQQTLDRVANRHGTQPTREDVERCVSALGELRMAAIRLPGAGFSQSELTEYAAMMIISLEAITAHVKNLRMIVR